MNFVTASPRPTEGPHRPTVAMIILASVIQALSVASLLGTLGLILD